MNKDQFAGKWHELKGKAKQKWAKLMDDDISHVNGKFEELSGKLQHRYGWSKDMADREITNWCASCKACSCGSCKSCKECHCKDRRKAS